jgi:signal transduction histidine kinase/CheY-like chemotaxis protein
MKINEVEKNLESVVMHIASRFINVSHNEYEKRLNEALELIGSFLDIDRVYMFDYDFEKNVTNNLFEWCNEGVEPQIMHLQGVPIEEIVDEWLIKHKNNEMVIYEDVEALDHDSMVYQILEPQGVLSICTVPLVFNGECLGFVGFDDVREKRIWKDSDFKLLSVLAELIVNTLVKQKNDHALFLLRENAIKANEAKSKFLAHMSHEIRTPLNGVHNAFYLLSQANSEQEQRKYIQIAQTSLEFLTSIVNNVLDISKIESGKMNVNYYAVDLEFEVVKTLRALKLSIKQKGLECLFDFDYSINKKVVIDLQKINQIIINLVNNAIKFTQKGQIAVSIKRSGLENAPMINISVKDDGVGISHEEQKRITEAFYQSSNQSSSVVGTGLGLSIVNHLVSLMGGKLKISSEPNKGSTFEVDLPLVMDEPLSYKVSFKRVLLVSNSNHFYSHYKAFFSNMIDEVLIYSDNQIVDLIDLVVIDEKLIKEDPTCLEKINLNYENSEKLVITDNEKTDSIKQGLIETPISIRDFVQFTISNDTSLSETTVIEKYYDGNILIVDDNMINRDALKAIVESHGLSCELAADGYQAIELCKINSYDLILMDIQMPKINGYEAAMKIRANQRQLKRTPIVAITANVFLNDYDYKMASHIDDIIFKPVKIDELLNMLDIHLDAKKIIPISDELQIMNLDTIKAVFEGNWDSASIMIEQFLNDCYKDFEKIKDAITMKDQLKIYKSLHYFKGPLSYFGADRLLYFIDILMNKSSNQEVVTIHDYKELNFELDQFIEELKGITNDFLNS